MVLRDLIRSPLALSLYLPSLIYAFSVSMLLPVMPLYASSFKVSYGLIGLLLAGQAIGYLLGDIPAGILLQKFGGKQVMVAGIVGGLIGTVALFWASSMPEAMLYRVLGGISTALYNVARHEYLSSAVITENRGRSIALYGGVFRMGRLVGPTAGAFIAGAFGLRVPFLVVGMAMGIALVAVLRYMPTLEVTRAPDSAFTGLYRVLRENRYNFLTAGMGQIFVQTVRAGREAIVPLYAADVLGLDVELIGLLQSIESALDVLMFYPAGIVMDGFGRKFAIVPSFIFQSLGMALIPLTSSFFGLAVLVGMMGFANGLSAGTMMTIGSDLAPQETRGQFLGVWRLIGDIGASGGPLMVGWVAGLLTLQASALVIAGSGVLAASIFAFRVPETLRKSEPPAPT
ncbi:MAG: MFS transporter [Aggregatilineales bacterium]